MRITADRQIVEFRLCRLQSVSAAGERETAGDTRLSEDITLTLHSLPDNRNWTEETKNICLISKAQFFIQLQTHREKLKKVILKQHKNIGEEIFCDP